MSLLYDEDLDQRDMIDAALSAWMEFQNRGWQSSIEWPNGSLVAPGVDSMGKYGISVNSDKA